MEGDMHENWTISTKVENDIKENTDFNGAWIRTKYNLKKIIYITYLY